MFPAGGGDQRIVQKRWLLVQQLPALLGSNGCEHATAVGEWVTTLGAHPSLSIGPLLESHKHDIGDIMRESLQHEGEALKLYRDLLKAVEGKFVGLEEFAREMIMAEEMHQAEVDKMLRKPGDMAAYQTNTRKA